MHDTTRTRFLGLGAALVLTVATGACSEDDNGGGGPAASTAYVGLLASTDRQSGPLNLTFASPVISPPAPQEAGPGPSFSGSAVVNVTGSLRLGGGPLVSITGTLNDEGGLAMTGGGYNLFGDLENGVIAGGFSGPGPVSGSLVAISSSDGSAALAFCGTFEGHDFDEPPSDNSGTFNLVVANGIAVGVAYDDEGSAVPIMGNSNATSISINQTDQGSGGTLVATGTYNATSLTGTFNVTLGGVQISAGTFSATNCDQPL